jgi:hypothetical protein
MITLMITLMIASTAAVAEATSPIGKAKKLAVTPAPAPVSTPLPTPKPNLSIGKNPGASELPFWRKKPELLKKLRDERDVLVSVKREDLEHPPGFLRFTMAGAGVVARPKEHCFRVSQNYPKLKEISDHFKTVSYDSNTDQLFLITEALGYQARMILKMTPVEEDWRSELQFEVVWGAFKGMKGVLGFEELAPGKTEVSIQAKYEASELPLPRILMGFALEVITQKVAEKMRSYIETQPMQTSQIAPVSPSPKP